MADRDKVYTIEDDSAPVINNTSTKPNLEPMSVSQQLETPEEYKLRKKSHMIVYFTAFIMSIGFSLVLTSVWPYLKQLDPHATKPFYGVVIAVNPLGQFLVAPLLGWIGNKLGSNRLVFIVTILFFIVGNLLFSLLRFTYGALASYCLMTSRFIVGVSSANIAICRSYLAASTTLAERSVSMGYVAAAQSLGFIFGPAIQTGLAYMIPEDSYPPYIPREDGTFPEGMAWYRPVWDLYTAAGWIAAIIGFFNLSLFLPCCYNEVNISAREARLLKTSANNRAGQSPKRDYCSLFVLLMNFFFAMFIYILIEAISVPLVKDLYAWTDELAIKVVGIALSVIGVVTFFMFFFTGHLVKRFDERYVYLFLGIFPLIFSMLLHIPMGSTYPLMQNCSATNVSDGTLITTTLSPSANESLRSKREVDMSYFQPVEHELEEFAVVLGRSKRAALIDDESACNAVGCPVSQTWCLTTPIIELPQLAVANLVSMIGFPVSFTLSSGIYSKMIGQSNQGAWMGLLTSIGSLSRMLGPVFVTLTYSNLGTRWTFGILAAIMVFAFICGACVVKRLVPLDLKLHKPAESEPIVSDTTSGR